MATSSCVFLHDLHVPAGHRCRKHGHEATEFVFSEACEGTVVQGGEVGRYSDSTVFVYQPGTTHWIENDLPGHQTCVGVVGMGAREIPPGVYQTTPEMMDLCRSVKSAVRRERRFDEQRLDLFAGLMALSISEAVCGPRPARSKAERVRDIIDAEFSEDWDVASLAREVYVSPDYLRQIFRSEYGEPVIHYLIERRIEYAKSLLRETDETVSVIADIVGYRDPLYFSRVFKKYAGCSPSTFREHQGR